MTTDAPFPPGSDDEAAHLIQWLDYLRGAILRKLDGLDERGARWRPDGTLISLIGIASHLTHVEWRWIEGGFLGADVRRRAEEFEPPADVRLDAVIDAYRERAAATDAFVRANPLSTRSPATSWAEGHDLRWVLLHLINETARHAGHADATRELLDGVTGE